MKPKNMPRPISVNAVGKPSMITTTIRPSIDSPSAALVMTAPRSPGTAIEPPGGSGLAWGGPARRPAAMLGASRIPPGAALARGFVDVLGLLDDLVPCRLVDIGAGRKLLLDHVHLLGV